MSNTACPDMAGVSGPLRIAGTVRNSIVDGPGIRYVIFVQGCPRRCEGCHNPQTHDFAGGQEADTEEILAQIFADPLLSGVTLSGGEPFSQAAGLLPVAESVKERGLHLMIYTGYLLEELQRMDDPGVQRLLELADILVDGPFVLAERDLTLQYRGSANQRVIDMKKSREAGQTVLYRSEYEDL